MATYSFTPPHVLEATPNLTPRFLSRYKWPRGVGLYLNEGSYHETRVMLEEHIQGKVDKVDYFIGGNVYSNVSQEVADVLTASGYGDLLTVEP